jgi:hypothetical protein
MRERADRAGVPPVELLEFRVWCVARGVEPPPQRPITHRFGERP